MTHQNATLCMISGTIYWSITEKGSSQCLTFYFQMIADFKSTMALDVGLLELRDGDLVVRG